MMNVARSIAFLLIGIVLAACAQETADELFGQGEQAAHKESTYALAQSKLDEFLSRFPDDPRADTALHVLARILLSQGRQDAAIDRYQELVRRFPKSRYADQAQFMVGFTYDQMGRLDRARAAYQKVIDAFPESDLADDARVSISNLGKPPEAWFPSDTTEAAKSSTN